MTATIRICIRKDELIQILQSHYNQTNDFSDRRIIDDIYHLGNVIQRNRKDHMKQPGPIEFDIDTVAIELITDEESFKQSLQKK